jgi:hypothetical protein
VRATTPGRLEQALARANNHAEGPVLVEAVLGPGDIPPLLADLARVVSPDNFPADVGDGQRAGPDKGKSAAAPIDLTRLASAGIGSSVTLAGTR